MTQEWNANEKCVNHIFIIYHPDILYMLSSAFHSSVITYDVFTMQRPVGGVASQFAA
jgi:hypothetical protein